jgi:hypothetical protein
MPQARGKEEKKEKEGQEEEPACVVTRNRGMSEGRERGKAGG